MVMLSNTLFLLLKSDRGDIPEYRQQMDIVRLKHGFLAAKTIKTARCVISGARLHVSFRPFALLMTLATAVQRTRNEEQRTVD